MNEQLFDYVCTPPEPEEYEKRVCGALTEPWNNDIPAKHPSPWPDGIVLPETQGQKAFREELSKRKENKNAAHS